MDTARRCHLYAPYDNLWNGIQKHLDAGVITVDQGQYQINSLLGSFPAPLNHIEAECLLALCESEEARLLISDGLRKRILNSNDLCAQFPSKDERLYRFIHYHWSSGKLTELKKLSPKTVRTVLQAIQEGRQISYQYRTNHSAEQRTGSCIPFRVEVSGFDGRWWLISYLREEKRPIKSRLSNLTEVILCEEHHLAEGVIRQGIESKLMPEHVVLRISADPDMLANTLERCFITFESMLDIEASKRKR